MQKRAKSKEPSPGQAVAKPTTLATLLAALGGPKLLPPRGNVICVRR
jgi:hypothetical protein